jgi:hypothetical protein
VPPGLWADLNTELTTLAIITIIKIKKKNPHASAGSNTIMLPPPKNLIKVSIGNPY